MDSDTPFFGRNSELEMLRRLLKKKTASLVVIKGRRRIGKSRLIEEFGKKLRTINFVGLPPDEKTSAEKQREDFALQIERQLNVSGLLYARDWGDLLWRVSQYTTENRVILVLDEINWIGSKDPTFLGKLKTAWDQYFKKNPNLILILSGSMSAWIEKNILSSTGFLGRVSLTMTLEELPLHQCDRFWTIHRDLISSYEKFKILSVTGGVPRYLEEVDCSLPANENIRRLCFEKEGILFTEFEKIFTDLFTRSGEIYRKILYRLTESSADLDQIAEALQVTKGGSLSDCLHNLVITGYISQDETWDLSTTKIGKLRHFRLKDNYLRFYLRYIEPNRAKIEKGGFDRPPAWDTIMGLQFENLVLNNAKTIQKLLHLAPSDIVFDNPFFQHKTKTQQGCQIDYLIQTRYNVLYVGEIKFSREKVSGQVIDTVKEKIKRIRTPKHFSFIPILIHVNGVTDAVEESNFFGKIINFDTLLNPPE